MYYKIRRRERYRTRRKKNTHTNEGDAGTDERKVSDEKEEGKTGNAIYEVKLPKLFAIKLNNAHLDWFCYWNQFESDIEKSELSPVSKFSYLK